MVPAAWQRQKGHHRLEASLFYRATEWLPGTTGLCARPPAGASPSQSTTTVRLDPFVSAPIWCDSEGMLCSCYLGDQLFIEIWRGLVTFWNFFHYHSYSKAWKTSVSNWTHTHTHNWIWELSIKLQFLVAEQPGTTHHHCCWAGKKFHIPWSRTMRWEQLYTSRFLLA